MIWLADTARSLSPHVIGTVVELGKRRFVVVGHRMVRDGVGVGVGYVLVPYPLGFVDVESLSVVPASLVGVGDVVAEGFANEAGERLLAELAELARVSAGIPYEEFTQGATLLAGLAREGGSDGAVA